MLKCRIFFDYWNFQLSLNEVRPNFRMDWTKISPWIVGQASAMIGDTLTHEETRIYMSYDPRKSSDKAFRGWAMNTLDRFPGIRVSLKERKRKSPPYCQKCHYQIVTCPNCNAGLDGMIEKGIDTAIVTDMLSLAWEGGWDVAVLVSSDRDFIPAVETLSAKGFRVLNAHFPPAGADLSRTCWASLDINSALSQIERQ